MRRHVPANASRRATVAAPALAEDASATSRLTLRITADDPGAKLALVLRTRKGFPTHTDEICTAPCVARVYLGSRYAIEGEGFEPRARSRFLPGRATSARPAMAGRAWGHQVLGEPGGDRWERGPLVRS